MTGPLRVYLSYHHKDKETVLALRRQMDTLWGKENLRFDDYESLPEDENLVEAAQKTMVAAQIALIFISPDYFGLEETLRERDYLKKSPSEPLLLPVLCRATSAKPGLEEYSLIPSETTPLANNGQINDVQCALTAQIIQRRTQEFLKRQKTLAPPPAWDLSWEQTRPRLLSFIAKNDLRAGLRIVHQLVKDPKIDKVIFEAKTDYQVLHRRADLRELSVGAIIQRLGGLYKDLEVVVRELEEEALKAEWRQTVEAACFGWRPLEIPKDTLPGLSYPAEDIRIPLLGLVGEQTLALSEEQQLEYKRLFILAQDAQAIGQYAKAYALAEQILTQINPVSAQLYELLLLTLVQKESPDKLIEKALQGRQDLIGTVLQFAGRFREFQAKNQCPSQTGRYNLSEIASVLQNAIRRQYARYPNDYILDTGLNAERHPDRRKAILQALQLALDLYHFLFPAVGFLEIACNEFCGGGKYLWADHIEVRDGEFQIINRTEFDLLSEIGNLQNLLNEIRDDADANELERQKAATRSHFNQLELLSNNLFFSLTRKRAILKSYIEEEKKFYREFVDERTSLVQLIYACLIGYLAFDKPYPTRKSRFLNMALDELLRQPVIPWFTLDENGRLSEHPDCQRCGFKAADITLAVIHQYTNESASDKVQQLVLESVYQSEFRKATELEHALAEGLAWTDFRKWSGQEARQALIQLMNLWRRLYLAQPDKGQELLKKLLAELCGAGRHLWMFLPSDQLQNHPDGVAQGFDAVGLLKQLQKFPLPWSETHIRQTIVDKLFLKHILPSYDRIRKGQETQRKDLIGLILQVMRGYRLDPQPVYLDWIYRELTEEKKFTWVEIDSAGHWIPASRVPPAFDPLAVLEELAAIDRTRYGLYLTRNRIADNRFKELEARYFAEISEYAHRNGLQERELCIAIFREIKSVFRFFPDARYLQIPLQELSGSGRIRWQARFLGIFQVPENHFENELLRFD